MEGVLLSFNKVFLTVRVIRFQLKNPNVSVSLLASQLSTLTDVTSGKPLYAGDLKLLVDVIGVLSERGLRTGKNESLETSEKFVKVSMVNRMVLQSLLILSFCFCQLEVVDLEEAIS